MSGRIWPARWPVTVPDEPDWAEVAAAERTARVAAERDRDRPLMLAQISEPLAATLDAAEALELLARELVPRLGLWCATYLLDETGDLPTVVASHRDAADPGIAADLALFSKRAPRALAHDSSTNRVLRGELASALIVKMTRASTAAPLQGNIALMNVVDRLGLGSAMVVPLAARGRLLGVFQLTGGRDRPDYDDDDLVLATELAHRAALALDNARLFARERAVAETLQRSLLPVLPEIDGIEVCAEYLPATAGVHVGGDWFDVFRLPDGATALVIGDVMGHDIAAAASMGQLRSVLRSYAWEGSQPARVLDRLDRLVQGFGMAQLATCIYAQLDDSDARGARRLRWANAGHLPPLLRTPDGQVQLLEAATGLLIGAGGAGSQQVARSSAQLSVPNGSVLLMYTDGLIEHRRRGIDEGLRALVDAVRAGGPDEPATATCARLADPLRHQSRDDDVAILAVSLHSRQDQLS